jgi:hypothetical protein
MKKENLMSPFVLTNVFFAILTVWISIFLHACFQFPHFHVVEKMMFSAYSTIIICVAISMGFGLVALVFSCVLWTVQKIVGIKDLKTDDIPIS